MSTAKEEKDLNQGADPAAANFIYDLIEDDNRSGKYGSRVVTRFPPEPNGYLHIGHAKSICLNFGIAEHYNSVCHLRFDDTNPLKEDQEYVEAIKKDVAWLGFDWKDKLFFGSDFFEEMYGFAVKLIKEGKAYVDSLDQEAIREHRGSLTEAGTNSPYRERSVEENLELFSAMRAGKFPDGAHVLRAKIDMASPNMLMRDPLLYRIRHATHHRTGDDWCIYPMYDYAHCLEDALEGVTHSLCTLEFGNNRELYDWVLEHTNAGEFVRPEQTEFARGNIDYTIMSKRNLLELVQGNFVDGWDDPRMPTIAAFRRRGVTPEAIRDFWSMVGVARVNSVVDVGKLEYCIRNDLNLRVPRVMCVLRPLKVVITNFPEDKVEELEAQYYPHDVPKEGSRMVPFAREILIEREDFREEANKKWYRLAPGREVRLRYGYIIKCDEVIRDPESGEVIELHCSYDPATLGAEAEGRKVKGTIHWVSAEHSLPAEVRLYDRLFNVKAPGTNPEVDFKDELNPGSLEILRESRVERSLADDEAGTRYQFERQGYFCSDTSLSSSDSLVFNRTVTLRDSWAKQEASSEKLEPVLEAPKTARKSKKREKPAARSKADERKNARAADPSLAARYQSYMDSLDLNEDVADRLTGDANLAKFFEAAVAAYDAPANVANWVVNEVQREIKDSSIGSLACSPEALGRLVRMVDEGKISGNNAKTVFSLMARDGGEPERIVEEKGLLQMSDEGALERSIDDVLEQNAENVARYRAGNPQLIGFFVGAVMRATSGKADARRAKEILIEKLS